MIGDLRQPIVTVLTLSALALALACSSPPAAPTCADAVQNGGESDIDCGGACGPCADLLACAAHSDCQSQVCERGVCLVPRCGDGVINQPAEICDDGQATAACNASCMLPSCGDGVTDTAAGEACDDGGESAACNGNCTVAACGDGMLNAAAGEDCDDAAETAACNANCTAAACGDGMVNATAGEDCDDGNADDSDDCVDVCVAARCGDGHVWAGMEECDDANGDDSDDCTSLCELADCADGILNSDELDVDCGGHCGARSCHGGQMCMDPGDCVSNSCVAGVCESSGGVVTGASHTCALDSTDAVRCWGSNNSGELGYGHTNPIGDNELPSSAGAVDVGGAVVDIAAGAAHTCALLATGAVRCWGYGFYGELGHGRNDNIGDDELPSSVGDIDVGGTVVQLVAGGHHTCVLLDTGAVRCWGRNFYGELGYGHMQRIGDDEAPASAGDVDLGGGVVVQLTAGESHTCALFDTGAVRCWGYNFYGQLGYGHTQSIGDNELPSTAGDVPLGGGRVIYIDGGAFHTCALLDTGDVRCWGDNLYGQLGLGNTSDIGDDELPSSVGAVNIGGPAALLVTSYYHNCVVLVSGPVRCWGHNEFGQLGIGHTQNVGDNELPWQAGNVSVGGAVRHLAVGVGAHTCARLTTGAIRCWGLNQSGRLGYGHVRNIGDDELPSSAGNVPYE